MKPPQAAITAKVRLSRGFTLTEILVTIVIIVVLAIFSVFGIRTLRQKAWAANASSYLRQNGTAIHGYVADKGRFPEAWDFGGGSGGGSWSWQIRDYLGYSNPESWPVETILHPRHGRKGIDELPDNARENIHHFAASAIVLQDVDETKTDGNKTYIRPGQVSVPSATIMLGDAPLKKPFLPSGGCHAAWWSLRFAAIKGSPSEPVDQNAVMNSVEFWFNGKAHFLFVDGHVDALAPGQVLRKHFQL
jgi:prepilin-type N-terminal cleavage/methylation domain-containing protein/prepilin-type processing-associated H-X9-DG protein